MSTKKRFADVGKMVKEILEFNVAARDSYPELLIAVAEKYGCADVPFAKLLRFWQNNLPSFESLTRARRKVAEENPALAPSDRQKAINAELAEQYKEYYKR